MNSNYGDTCDYQVISVQQPAAGAEINFKLAAPQLYEIYSITFLFTASAAVANRQPTLQFKYRNTIFYQAQVSASITAAQAVTIQAAPTAPLVAAVSTFLYLPLPSPCILPPETIIQTTTANIQSGDQYSAIAIYTKVIDLEEQLEGGYQYGSAT
jgi:hypothetical protein